MVGIEQQEKRVPYQRVSCLIHFRQFLTAKPDAQAAGEIREDVDVSMARLNLFGMMNWSIEWYRPGRLDIEELADNMCRTLFDGIGSANLARTKREPIQ